MPIHDDGAPTTPYASTNSALRKEIRDDIAAHVTGLAAVKQEGNSLFTSTNFHLDSRHLSNGRWKVEIQYVKGKGPLSGKTVVVVLVEDMADDVAGFRDAVWQGMNTGHLFRVS